MAKMTEKSARDFIEWLKASDPFLYAVSVRAQKYKDAANQNMSGIFDILKSVDFGKFASTAIETVKDVAPKVIEFKQQKDLLDVQIKRAQQGLPALDTNQYAVTVPNFDPNHVTARQQSMIDKLAYQSVYQPSNVNTNTLTYVGLGLGLLGILLTLKNRG